MTLRAFRSAALAAAFAVAAFGAQRSGAEAAELKVISTIGVKMSLPDIIAEFEKTTGHKVSVHYGTAAALKTDIVEGKLAGDVSVLTAQVIDDLTKQGSLAAGSRVDLAKSGTGFGVKAGAPKPDVSTPEALKKTLLAAKTIGYSKLGASGTLFLQVAEKLGIANEIKPKLVETSGVVGELIVEGKAEIGVQQVPELMAVPGIAIAGPLPGDFQVITTFSAALSAKPQQEEAAKAFIKFLGGTAAQQAFKAKGLDPA
jgi:molybdate transport system substrate-binding protein